MMDDFKEVIGKAADEIERRGLMHGLFMEEDGNPDTCKVCVAGAINFVVNGDPTDCYENDVVAYARDLAFALGHAPLTTPLYRWNDTRTTEEVVAALREVAR